MLLSFPTFLVDALPSFAQSHNATLQSLMTPTSIDAPFYHTTRSHLFDWISDRHLSLFAPVAIYWVLSTIFHALDTAELPYFEARRIHESAEVKAKNRATLKQVITAVFFQQVVQTIFGLLILESDESVFKHEISKDHLQAMRDLVPRVADFVFLVLGPSTGQRVLEQHGAQIVNTAYWWAIPTAQMFIAFCIIDTWQYFLHRAMHTYPSLYRAFHSHHHRLINSYAFGALYNHPVEGLILDTVGAGLASIVTFMTVRQSTLLFTMSTWKTVDDHCGYRLWWDPCQLLFANNADYHDIHHQTYGIKSNFAQPFFTNWDYLLGTQMTRHEFDTRTGRRGVTKEE